MRGGASRGLLPAWAGRAYDLSRICDAEGVSSREEPETLPADLVRWISAAFFLLFVVSTLLFFPRPDRRAPREVRASHPLSFITGPLWATILIVVFLALLAEAIAPDWVYGGPLTLPIPYASVFQGVGMLTWLVGGGLALWSERTLGRFTRPEIEVLADHELVTGGPYRWIRHPLYTALLLMSAGVALLLLNAFLIAVFFAACGIAQRRAVLEEELLASEGGFGSAYRSYMERTGRFLPRRGRHPVDAGRRPG
jgi:protein-S-isoprenylcysteine O-methyltransferase Ste14